jgi:hypothetical protein
MKISIPEMNTPNLSSYSRFGSTFKDVSSYKRAAMRSAKSKREAKFCLLYLFYNPKVGDGTILRNVAKLLQDCKRSYSILDLRYSDGYKEFCLLGYEYNAM